MPSHLYKLAEYFNTSIDYLITGRPGVTPEQLKESAETGKPISEYEKENGKLLEEQMNFKEHTPVDYGSRKTCPNCLIKDAEITFLRRALESALDRIPKS